MKKVALCIPMLLFVLPTQAVSEEQNDTALTPCTKSERSALSEFTTWAVNGESNLNNASLEFERGSNKEALNAISVGVGSISRHAESALKLGTAVSPEEALEYYSAATLVIDELTLVKNKQELRSVIMKWRALAAKRVKINMAFARKCR